LFCFWGLIPSSDDLISGFFLTPTCFFGSPRELFCQHYLAISPSWRTFCNSALQWGGQRARGPGNLYFRANII
jgi:hypothetical protein